MYTQESQDVNSYEDKNGNKVYYDGNTQKTLGSGGGNEGGDKDKGNKDKNGNTIFNGGYRDKSGKSHYYPSMDVTGTMSDEGRETYNRAALKETAIALIPLGRIFRILGINRVGSYIFGRAISSATSYLTERAIINETRIIMQNENLIRKAFESGVGTELQIGGRTIIVEPQAPISGMTWFADNSFVIGKEAFSSRPELIKTILHELYRLHTSTLRGATGIQELVSKETAAAASFAEKTFNQIK